MTFLPSEIWHSIAGKLAPRDLFSFLLTHRHGYNAVSQDQVDHVKRWDSIFKNYDWIHKIQSTGSTPALICRDGEKPYIYLLLVKAEKRLDDPVFLDILTASLHVHKRGTSASEVDFGKFTLNIADLLYPGPPISQKDLEWMRNGEKVQVVIFEKGFFTVKPQGVSRFGWIDIPESTCTALFEETNIDLVGFVDFSRR